MSDASRGPHPAPITETGGSAFLAMLAEIWQAADGRAGAPARVVVTGAGSLQSVFPVSDLAAASIAAAGLAISELVGALGAPSPRVEIDRRLASLWFGTSLRPVEWSLPPAWDPIAGDYQASDGWIRLHTNTPSHRAAALAVLDANGEKEDVARRVARWPTEALESAIVDNGGCAAKMRSFPDWMSHAQGRSVASEPLIRWDKLEEGAELRLATNTAHPLAGLKVLDLTRVLAGPIGTRFLAGYGAQVLRIDPPDWDEPGLVPEVMIGKRTARLDLRTGEGRAQLLSLLADADILVHGYRPEALERLGLGAEIRRRTRPGLIDVSLDAYGWTGPWSGRRGFDSLVQMSTGIAEAGMREYRKDRPTPLPVQALDHATGYMMAAAAILSLIRRLKSGQGQAAKVSLARTGLLLVHHIPVGRADTIRPEEQSDLADGGETTIWGRARRLRPPLAIEGAPMLWDRSASPIGTDQPCWNA